MGAGNDVLVLSSNHSVDGADTTSATVSNEKIVYSTVDFGNDTIVNFNSGDAAPFSVDGALGQPDTVNAFSADAAPTPVTGTNVDAGGEDKLDFTALGGKTLATAVAVNNAGLTTGAAAAAGALNTINVIKADVLNDTAAEIAAFFNATTNVAATQHIVVVVSTDNVGTVYQVSDAIGAGTATATAAVVGTIDLADTDWAWLSQDNFA